MVDIQSGMSGSTIKCSQPAILSPVALLYLESSRRKRTPGVERFRAYADRGILQGQAGMVAQRRSAVRRTKGSGPAGTVGLAHEFKNGIHGIKPDPDSVNNPGFVKAPLRPDFTLQMKLGAINNKVSPEPIGCDGAGFLDPGLLEGCPYYFRARGRQFDPGI
jgi:hypothetical protein